ncbi:MAG TPA: hypothetical protein VIL49_09910 [Capillimicrobium sp.]
MLALLAPAQPVVAHDRSSPADQQARAVLADCASHGRLTKSHPTRALKRAKRTLASEADRHRGCAKAIDRAIARRSARPGRGPHAHRVRSVIEDCLHDGHLDRRFAIATLRRTLRSLPADVVTYTDCDSTIRREIRLRT